MECVGPKLVHTGVKTLSCDCGDFGRGSSKEVVEPSVDVEDEQFDPLVEVWE
jgi:hypothetical protein